MRGASVGASVFPAIGLGFRLSISFYDASSAARAVEVGGVDLHC